MWDIIEALIFALLLSYVGFDDVIISGVAEWSGVQITQDGYYVLFLVAGVFTAVARALSIK